MCILCTSRAANLCNFKYHQWKLRKLINCNDVVDNLNVYDVLEFNFESLRMKWH